MCGIVGYIGKEKALPRVLRGLKFLEVEEQKIIKLRFFAEKTQTETAEILNISQVQVSRKEKKALEKLKRYMRSQEKQIKTIKETPIFSAKVGV